MTAADRQAHKDHEQRLLREAMQRLLAGVPQRSNGTLTVATLAAEAGLPRHRLYEHHADLAAEFKAAAGGGPPSPRIQAFQQQLVVAHDRIQTLEASNKLLRDRITMLCAAITELTHEATASNVVALSRSPDRNPIKEHNPLPAHAEFRSRR